MIAEPITHVAAAAVNPDRLLAPYWAKITAIQPEADGIATYWLEFKDKFLQSAYTFEPGQFNMIYVPGYGEAAISISSDPNKPQTVGHTIRFVGNVTRQISRLKVGDVVGVRGPFGSSWPMKSLYGSDVIIAAGGIGLPPLRPVIDQIIHERERYGKVVVLYGARTPNDLLFMAEIETWRRANIEVNITVDRADEKWTGQVGVVPLLFYHFRINPAKTTVLSCGPEIMIRFVVFEALARRVPADRIYVSLERNMKCGQAACGHCQIGPYFVCKDGPVFRYQAIEPYFNVEEF
jgi:NAD(P)H-flavin reductase